MLKVENRESAHLKSRVKDLSVVPNLVSYTGLFTCITPISKLPLNADDCYDPILIRDRDSLISTFGDPRIDPEKYIDLYSIMQMVVSGTSCYISKVPSGTNGAYTLDLGAAPLTNLGGDPAVEDQQTHIFTLTSDLQVNPDITVSSVTLTKLVDQQTVLKVLKVVKRNEVPSNGECIVSVEANKLVVKTKDSSVEGYSLASCLASTSDKNYFVLNCDSSTTDVTVIDCSITEAKPFSLKKYYLNVSVSTDETEVSSAKIELSDTLTNSALVNSLNSLLSPYVAFSLVDESHSGACVSNDDKEHSMIYAILDHYTRNQQSDIRTKEINAAVSISSSVETDAPNFEVNISDYEKAINQYKDKRYAGCLMADLVSPLTHKDSGVVTFDAPDPSERRTLHFYLKSVAVERKDVSVILSVPLVNYIGQDPGTKYKVTEIISKDDICNWVASQGDYSDLWEYGKTNTTDYSEQSFYLEIYYTWLNMQCTKYVNGFPTYITVPIAPANVVANNILTSFRERGTQYPVAGDQYGTLPDSVSVIVNPKTKIDRDQLVQYRINPIWDTGTRGVQIYGNETLNAGYTDLNAAHVARSLINLRNRIDEYTETLKFTINNTFLWDTWKAYVSANILEPAVSNGTLKEYAVAMGEDTTTPEEIANRMVKGQVSLIFYQSAEIFDLTFTVFSSATTL